ADFKANNGVVHVIDSVLVPTNFTYQEVKEDETLPYTGSSSNYTLIALAIGLVSIVALRIRKAKVN
ncbi:MAG: LPXTG cell wall anchor domain-containing protein, partial [Vallitaleaceae bacterium]|nr:LPXTG cell wall anchor domain-containing protein [Vallitaleaceae bacterium]